MLESIEKEKIETENKLKQMEDDLATSTSSHQETQNELHSLKNQIEEKNQTIQNLEKEWQTRLENVQSEDETFTLEMQKVYLLFFFFFPINTKYSRYKFQFLKINEQLAGKCEGYLKQIQELSSQRTTDQQTIETNEKEIERLHLVIQEKESSETQLNEMIHFKNKDVEKNSEQLQQLELV